MRRKITALLLGLMAIALLAGMAPGCPPASDGGTGTVIKSERHTARNSPNTYYEVTIRRDNNGQPDSGYVDTETGKRCSVGKHWPECKKGRS